MPIEMMGFDRTDDYQPLTYIKGRPLYVTTLAVALHIAAFIVGCFLYALRQGELMSSLLYSSDAVLDHLQLWRCVTYAFVHSLTPVGGVLLAIELFILFQLGQEVEKYFGRKVFIGLYVGLLLTPPLVLSLFGKLTHQPMILKESSLLHFGIFIAFVTLYPNVQFIFGILAKWIVFAVLGIFTLVYMANRQPAELLALWSTASVAYFITRQSGGGGGEFSLINNIREKFPRRPAPVGVKPRMKPRRAANENAGGGGDVYESIDPLLDKISQHGLASLTNSERATLERARVSLLRKDRSS